MRGVARDEKSEVIDLLQQGIAPSVIIKELGLPKSTVCDWANQLKKDNAKNITIKRSGTIDSYIKKTEIKITNALANVISPEISDDEWFNFEDVIHREITYLIDQTLKSMEG